MDPVMIVLRTFHILGGALWFGSAFLFAGFFGPASAETAPSSGPIMSNVVKKRRIATVIAFLASDYSTYMTGEVVSVSSQHP